MGHIVLIKPGQKANLLDRLLRESKSEPEACTALHRLREARFDRIEVCLGERRCRLFLETGTPVDPETERWLGEGFCRLTGLNLKVSLAVRAPIREYLSASVSSADAERDRLLEMHAAEEEALIQELLSRAPAAKKTEISTVSGPDGWAVFYGKSFGEPAVNVGEVTEPQKRTVLEGEVLSPEIRALKTGRRLLSFDLTDYSDTISVKCFLGKDDSGDRILPLGAWIRVRGSVQPDRFNNGELCLIADDILLGGKMLRQDPASEKRVELHLHTKMSSMDGCLEVAAAVERAAYWGLPALAVTDHGVVQGFPAAYAAGKKHGVKIIFGMEGYLLNDPPSVVSQGVNKDLAGETPLADLGLVAVDIETTGLSPAYGEIIEIGAVRYRHGQAVDEFSALIAPARPLSQKIQTLTGISAEMLRDAGTATDVLKRFWDWAGPDAVLVAHNAAFDFSFLRVSTERLLRWSPDYPVIDTLWMARALLPRLKSHNLASVSAELKIRLENHHRALSDAKTAGAVFFAMLAREQPGHAASPRSLDTVADLSRLTEIIQPEAVRPVHVTILAKNQKGLKNLFRLVSQSHLDYFYRQPRIPRRLLQEHREGLLIGSACESGEVYAAILNGAPVGELRKMAEFYDFLEIMPRGNNQFLIDEGHLDSKADLEDINRQIYELGQDSGRPVVATGDVHYLDERDEIYRRILKTGQGFTNDGPAELHFRTTAEMLEEFSYLGEEVSREVVVANTRALAESVEEVRPVPEGIYAPEMPGADEEIRQMALERARELYGDPLPELVGLRLQKELQAIIGNGFAVIYHIAHKLVKKSLDDGYLVGSRGSVGSSLVATMCRITEVNPLPPHYRCPRCLKSYFITDGSVGSGFDLPNRDCPDCGTAMAKDGQDIPFETFLGFDGDKVPDIDLNFSGQYQAVVHKYTEELFGPEYVFRAGTIATIAERTAFGFVKSFNDKEGRIPRKAELNRLASGLTGVKRTTGQHPGGMIIVPQGREIEDFTPVQYPADDRNSSFRTTHFDFHSIHDNLLKLDILGHDDPTVLRMLQDLTGVNVKTIPFDDPETQSLFYSQDVLGIPCSDDGRSGEGALKTDDVGTIGVPEFGTGFVRRMLIETRPKTFSDLVRISGLSHGTDVWTNNAQDLIKSGTAALSEVIPCRDDIMVYLMYKGLKPKTAFKIMERVRKGKGLASEDEEAMRAAGVPGWYIESCQKIKYMFPKAHAVAYVMMGFRIAWFKVHYPLAFYAAYFTVRADEFDAEIICAGPEAIRNKMAVTENNVGATAKEKNLATILEVALEMYARGFGFRKVDLYKSHATDFLIDDLALRPPLKSLQGLGETAAARIVAARSETEFSSLEDLRVRAKLNKTVIELLVSHGAAIGLPDNNQLALF